jgi:hypothetical protein
MQHKSSNQYRQSFKPKQPNQVRQPVKPAQIPTKEYNVVENLQDYMFTGPNLLRYATDLFSSSKDKPIANSKTNNNDKTNDKTNNNDKTNDKTNNKTNNKTNDNTYKPLKKDSLFWCFFILKHGFSKYEMEIGSQHFTVEKNEKFRYIELLREKANKDLMKINKIKPLSELEDDLANKDRISIKTFFALCIIEKMNILLVDNRKIYQTMNNDSPTIHVIHRNSKTFENYIELNVTDSSIDNYKNNYYNVDGFENGLKSMSAYKVDELLELCKKLNINLDNHTTKLETKTESESKPKKLTKKDIYELIVQNL